MVERSETRAPLSVALIGCGQIADAHLQEIRRIPLARVVAVCDREPDLARQAAERFDVPSRFTTVDEMFAAFVPDVVHVTTPPHSHSALVTRALDAGCHVYVEKPFTVTLDEAAALVAHAELRGRSICVGHDQLFDPVWLECMRRWRAGEIGDVVHVDCIQGYDLSGPFGSLLAADPHHWVHRLPGGLFQNVISHACARIVPFLDDESEQMTAVWSRGQRQLTFPTELRMLVQGRRVSASLVFSSTARPVQRITRVFGTRATLEVDFDSRLIRTARPASTPGALAKVELAWMQARESAANLRVNITRLLRSDLHFFAGMHRLFTAFYTSILERQPPPVTYDEALRVTALMERGFTECTLRDSSRPRASRLSVAS